MTTNQHDRTTEENDLCAFLESLSDDELAALFTVGDVDEDLSAHIATCGVCGSRVEQVLTRETTVENEVAAFDLMVNRALAATRGESAGGRARLRLMTKAMQPKVDVDATPLKLAAEDSPAQWPVSIDAEIEDGEHVQFAFQPAGFGLAVTLSPDSRGPVVVTSGRINREVILTPGIAASLGTLFDTKLTAASSPEQLLRQLDAADLSIRRKP